MRFFGFILSLIVLSQLAPASQGALIAYESFTGTAGATLNGTAGGSGWTNAWSSVVPTQVTFVNQSLSYSAGQVTINGGTSALQIAGSGDLFGNREFANQTGTVYFSFLFQTSTSAGLTDDFAQFGLDTTNVNPRTSLGHTSTSGTDATNTEFFARGGTTATNSAYSGIDTANNQTYFVVGRVTKGGGNYNSVALFFNPTTITEPGVPTAVSNFDSGISDLDTFVMRMARLESTDRYVIDELRITTTFAEALGVPEPASLTLFACGAAGLALVVWRRRRVAAA